MLDHTPFVEQFTIVFVRVCVFPNEYLIICTHVLSLHCVSPLQKPVSVSVSDLLKQSYETFGFISTEKIEHLQNDSRLKVRSASPLTPSHRHALTPSHYYALTPSRPHTLTPSQVGQSLQESSRRSMLRATMERSKFARDELEKLYFWFEVDKNARKLCYFFQTLVNVKLVYTLLLMCCYIVC